MKRIILKVLLLATAAGCEPQTFIARPPIKKERPTVNLPLSMRQENWLGSRGEGSCVWASTISLLRWQGRYQGADWVRRNYGGGEWPDDWAVKMNKAGLRYAFTTSADVEFLEWALRTRRGAAVTIMGGAHCVNLVHLDDDWVCLLDNNAVRRYQWVPRERFLAEWRASLGWGLAVIYTPAAPLPQ